LATIENINGMPVSEGTGEILISVIIPVYKVEKYLRRCIDSVLNQTFDNFEVILIDDGSPDGCGAICDHYARLDRRVRVIHKPNEGVSAARNDGIDLAKGRYIAFLDSDDWVHTEYLERLLDIALKTGADIVICDFTKVEDDAEPAIDLNENVRLMSNADAVRLLVRDQDLRMVVPWNKLYKRAIFDGIRFPVGRRFEDEAVVHHYLYKAEKIALTSDRLVFYYLHDGSYMAAPRALTGELQALEAFHERAVFLRSVGFDDLSRMVYKAVFTRYLKAKRKISGSVDPALADSFNNGLVRLRAELRGARFNARFKIFYEAYFLMPALMDRVHRINERIGRKAKMKRMGRVEHKNETSG